MITIRQNTAWGLLGASRILLLCITHASYAPADEPRPATRFADLTTKAGFRGDRKERPDSPARHFQNIHAQGGHALVGDLKFTHLTTNDGLSQSYVTAILQDRRGFMWFATRGGLNRYDGNTFVAYKHNPNDPDSLSSNFIQDLIEDDHGYLWTATNVGVNKFDPGTERFTRYVHDPNNQNSIGGTWVKSIAQDSRGYLWIGTEDGGLNKFDPTTGRFTHYRNDSDGQFVGRITHVIADRQGNIWFVGERGLFHLNPLTGLITHPSATMDGLSAECVYEDETGNLWLLALFPIFELVEYDRHAERFTRYPLGARAVGVVNSNLLADGQNGLWVPSSQGLYYFDRREERFTYRFKHEENNPDSLDSNAILSVYQDRAGVLWVGTENAGLNILNFRQEQFVDYMHRPADPNSISPGRVKAIYQEPNGVLWVGFFPRALNRFDRKTGQITHYDENTLGKGTTVTSIYKDAAGYLWVAGGDSGLDRFDERTGRFKHYRHNPDDPNSLTSDTVYKIYGDRNGQIWVAHQYGIDRFDPATDRFTNYRPVPNNPASLANRVWVIYQDRSGTLWLGTWGGELIHFDDKAKTFVNYAPDSRDPHRLSGGGINTIHEDRTGTLWVGAFDGLYRYNRQSDAFTRYTESQGLPSSSIRCIQEDEVGRLWLSTQKGISRFDPKLESFRNYDVSDGLQSNEFSDGCYQGSDGEIFFGGSNGFNAFFPENIRDNPYIPPVVITSFKIFNKPVPIGAKSVLTKGIPYTDSLTLSYRDNVFSFEFAALSYANAQKNRYRYKLEGFDPGWNEVGSKQRLATYTNLDPGKYVFRVEGSNSDGVWNEEGVSLPILIPPPWWRTNWFRALCAAVFLAMLWAAYQFRVRQLQQEFNMQLQSDFVAAVSHELRSPLTTLRTIAELLVQDRISDESRRRQSYHFLERETTRLQRMVEDLLDFGRMESGRKQYRMEFHDLFALVRAAVVDFREEALASGFQIEVKLDGDAATVKADEEALRRALRNLLENAVKYSPKCRTIWVDGAVRQQHVTISIRDRGMGIEPREHREIFQKFARGTAARKAGIKGTGLGLSMVRQIIDACDGQIRLESAAGVGSTFTIVLPLVNGGEKDA